MVFFAFSGVEAQDGPGTERLKLGGEMQARAGGLQPWIMPRKTTRLIPLLERCLHVTCGLLPFNENLRSGVFTQTCSLRAIFFRRPPVGFWSYFREAWPKTQFHWSNFGQVL